MLGKKKKSQVDEFVFDEDGDQPLSEEEEYDEPPVALMKESGGRRLSGKVLLLGFLLVAAAGGAYYYFFMLKPTPAPPPVARKPVVVVPKAATPPPAVPVAKPSPPPPAPAVPAAGGPVAVKGAPTVAPVAGKPTVPAVPPAPPVAPPTVRPVATPVPAAPAIPLPRPVAAKASVAQEGVGVQGGYTLAGGAFVSQEVLRDVERKVRKLGYTPQVRIIQRKIPMLRLRVGVFDVAEAERRRAELARKFEGAFTLRQGDKVALYAGSYFDIDKGRSFADQLFLAGVHVDEERSEVLMPLHQVHYGVFPSRAAAEKAAGRALSAGLEAEIIKRK